MSSRVRGRSVVAGRAGRRSAWRLLVSPARPLFQLAAGGDGAALLADLGRDGVVLGDDLPGLLGADGVAVQVADLVGLAASPAGDDAGAQDGGDVAERGVVVLAVG